MSSVLNTINEGFVFIGAAQAATEVKDSIIIFQWEVTEEFFQFFEAITNLRRIRLMGLSIGLVKLIQDGFTITIPGVEGVGGDIIVKLFTDRVHTNTPCVPSVHG